MPRARRPERRRRDVKDRLIQTRVPERLESELRREAQKQRLSVSHLIRNVLEDTLRIVDSVAAGAGSLVEGSVGLAESVARDAGKIASTVRQAVKTRAPGTPPDAAAVPDAEGPGTGGPPSFEHVLGWNPAVVNRPTTCAGCGAALGRGSAAHLGLSQDPAAAPTWLCPTCLARL